MGAQAKPFWAPRLKTNWTGWEPQARHCGRLLRGAHACRRDVIRTPQGRSQYGSQHLDYGHSTIPERIVYSYRTDFGRTSTWVTRTFINR